MSQSLKNIEIDHQKYKLKFFLDVHKSLEKSLEFFYCRHISSTKRRAILSTRDLKAEIPYLAKSILVDPFMKLLIFIHMISDE